MSHHAKHNPHDASEGAPLSEQQMLDPHGYHKDEHHHGHVIIPQGTLLGILIILLIFTVLTVFASRAEILIADAFNLNIPQWVNVMVAMSIATVKSALVALYFMQLKYDNKLNAVIFLASLFCVGLFLGFTMLDIGVRGSVYTWKVNQITPGGTGGPTVTRSIGGQTVAITSPITTFARDQYIQQYGESKWEAKMAEKDKHAHHDDEGSSADRSRPREGITPGLFDPPGRSPSAGRH